MNRIVHQICVFLSFIKRSQCGRFSGIWQKGCRLHPTEQNALTRASVWFVDSDIKCNTVCRGGFSPSVDWVTNTQQLLVMTT